MEKKYRVTLTSGQRATILAVLKTQNERLRDFLDFGKPDASDSEAVNIMISDNTDIINWLLAAPELYGPGM